MLRWRQRKSATEALGGPKGAWSCSSSPKGRGLDAPARSVSAPDGRYGGGEGAEESMPEKHCMALRIAELGRRCIGIPSSRAGLGVAWPQPSTTAVQPLKKGPEGVSVRPRNMPTRDLCGQLAPARQRSLPVQRAASTAPGKLTRRWRGNPKGSLLFSRSRSASSS